MIRVFLDWDGPALPRAAHVLLDRYAEGRTARLDGAVVALPGARAGRRLKEVLVEEAAARGLRLVPPRVTTLGRVPELLYEPRRPPVRDAVSRLAWAGALRATAPERLEAVFSRRPESDDPAEWAGLAREVARLHRSVAAGGWRFDDVAGRCRSGAAAGEVEWDDAERWKVLAGVQRRYEGALEAMERGDPDLLRIAALREGELRAPGDIWLVGVSEMPRVVRLALEAVGDRVHALIHAPEARAAAFDALGCVLPEAWNDAPVPVDEARLSVRDRPEHQADEAARVLAGIAGEGAWAADEVVVGVPDPEVVPWMEERLTSAGVPVRSAAGERIEATGPYRALVAVTELLDGGRFEAMAALLRHPDVEAWAEADADDGEGAPRPRPGAVLEALDRAYAQVLPARAAGALRGARGEHGRRLRAVVERVRERLVGDLTAAPSTRPLSAWVVPILELLSRLYGHRDLTRQRPRDRALLRGLDVLARAAGAFRDLPASVDRRCRASTALRLVLEEAAGAAVPAAPERAAVELLGWLELHLDDAPVTILTGVNEPGLPESVTGDPFLPDALRARLGLEDNRLRYARDAYRLTAMIHARKELHMVAGRRSATGDPLRPSRLLLTGDGKTAARRLRRFYDEEEASGVAAAPGAEPPPPESKASAFALPPEPELRLPAPVESLRVTDFRALLGDPYTFALQRYRGCEVLDDGAREMDGLLFGSLAHRVLERFGSSDRVHAVDEAAVAAHLNELLEEEVRRAFGPGARAARVAVRLQVEQLRARLRRFARWHAAWIGDGWRVRAVECATAEGGAPLDVDGTPVGIRARIDRVDHHPGTGRWAVFDYKTSDKPRSPRDTHRKNRDSEWCDLQLPLYRWLLPRVVDRTTGDPLFPDIEQGAVEVGYILLPRELDSVGESLAMWGEADFAAALDAARDVIRELRSGPFRYDPDAVGRWTPTPLKALLGQGQLAAPGPGDDTYDEDEP